MISGGAALVPLFYHAAYSAIDQRKEVLGVDGAATAWGVAMADLDQGPATPPSRGNREDGGRPREDSGRVGGPRQSRAVQGVARGTDSTIGRSRALAESIGLRGGFSVAPLFIVSMSRARALCVCYSRYKGMGVNITGLASGVFLLR